MQEQDLQMQSSEVSNVTEVVNSEPEVSSATPEQSDAPESNVSETADSNFDYGSNPENAKKRIDNKNRRLQRRIDELENRLENLNLGQSNGMGNQPQEILNQQNFAQPTSVVDPITGEYLSPGTGRYDAVLLQQQQQALAEQRQQQTRQQEAMRYQKQLEDDFFDSLDDAKERYADFDEVVANENIPITPAMVQVAQVTPRGADLLYYVAKNPKEVQRISQLHPLMQQREMAAHAMRFASQQNVSKAPAPVQTVGSTPGGDGNRSFSRLALNPTALKHYLRDKQRRKA